MIFNYGRAILEAALLALVLGTFMVDGQRGSSIHWPMAFVAKGHANEWNSTSIVYYDWKQRAMRRDTILVYPPSHFNPENNQIEWKKKKIIITMDRNSKNREKNE